MLERPVAPVTVQGGDEGLLRLVGLGEHGARVAQGDVDADRRRPRGQRREPGQLRPRLVRMPGLDGGLGEMAEAAARLHPLVRRVLRLEEVPQVVERLVRPPEPGRCHPSGEVGDREADGVPRRARQLRGPGAQARPHPPHRAAR